MEEGIMRTPFITQSKDEKEKNFWSVLVDKLNLKPTIMKMASANIDKPREIVKEGLVISYKPSGEYTIKLGHKSDIVVTGVARQEKELHQHVKNALSYLKSISPSVASELKKIEAEKRDILVYKDIDRCRDCVFYESDTSHETYRDKCKNCIHATLGGGLENFFPRSQQMVVFVPQWGQVGDVEPKIAFQGTMSLLDAHKKGMVNERHHDAIANEILASVKEKSAVNLGTAMFKYFESNRLNFQHYARPVIESIEKQAGIQIHIRKGDNVILAVDTISLNPEVMTDEEKDKAGEAIKAKLEAGYDLTDEEKNFLDSWLLVFQNRNAEKSESVINIGDMHVSDDATVKLRELPEISEGTTINRVPVEDKEKEEKPELKQEIKDSKKEMKLSKKAEGENVEFKKHERVHLKSDPNVKGTYMEIQDTKPGDIDVLVVMDKAYEGHNVIEVMPAELESDGQQATAEQQSVADEQFASYKDEIAQYDEGFKDKVNDAIEGKSPVALGKQASKKSKDVPGSLSKCDQEALDKYEEAKDKPTKSKEIMPKGKFDGTLCLAEAEEDEEIKTYKVVKYFKDKPGKQQTMARGLSRDEAKSYCSRPETKKEGEWFCGFVEE